MYEHRIKPFLHNAKQLLIALDQVARVLLALIICLFRSDHYGYADETLSAYAWRKHRDYWYANLLRIVIDVIFLDMHHCENSYISEVLKKHLPDDYKKE